MPPPRRPPPFICRNCLRQLRTSRPSSPLQRRPRLHHRFSTRNPLLPPQGTPSFAHLPNRRLISLSGPDAAHFLQGLTTVNITSQAQKAGGLGFYSAFLNASGRVLYDVFIYPTRWRSTVQNNSAAGAAPVEGGGEGGFLIDVDVANEAAEGLARHLRKYKLRAKVAIRLLDEDECAVYATWGPNDGRESGSHHQDEGVIGSLIDDRVPGMGQRIMISMAAAAGRKATARLGASAEEVSPDIYTVRRLMNGVPEGPEEITPATALPQESNIDLMGGIDFRKGCYVGQELTIRTHHTGVVRKRILPVRLYRDNGVDDEQQTQHHAGGEEPAYDHTSTLAHLPARGANISRVDSKRGRSAGKWLGGVGNVGLALCRLEVMTETVLTGEGSQWKAEDEFQVAVEAGEEEKEGREAGTVKVKAFIPAWHKERVERIRVRHGT